MRLYASGIKEPFLRSEKIEIHLIDFSRYFFIIKKCMISYRKLINEIKHKKNIHLPSPTFELKIEKNIIISLNKTPLIIAALTTLIILLDILSIKLF